jgi:hypothetical protein
METLIVVCLLMVIFLLLQDKIALRIKSAKKVNQGKTEAALPDIMGLPRASKRLLVPNTATESHKEEKQKDPGNFVQEIDREDVDVQIPQEEPDDDSENVLDLEQEEEELKRYRFSDEEVGFAQGVTFEELGTVEMVLRLEKPELSLEKQAVDIVHKIQGTDLFFLLENSVEGASQKIARLLDRSLSSNTDSGSSIMRKNELDDFDIGEFV